MNATSSQESSRPGQGVESDAAEPRALPRYDVVAFGASAGGISALRTVLRSLPQDFPAAIIIVQHLDPRHHSLLAEILGRYSLLPAKQAEGGDKLEPGHVYIAPPDRHLVISADMTLTLVESEPVHFVRPAADLLFQSMSATYGAKAIAVVLTGTGQDGATGVSEVKRMGGTVIAQDEGTSEFFSMPSHAVATGNVDLVLPLDEIAAALVRLVTSDEP